MSSKANGHVTESPSPRSFLAGRGGNIVFGALTQGGARASLVLIPYPKLFTVERSWLWERSAARL